MRTHILANNLLSFKELLHSNLGLHIFRKLHKFVNRPTRSGRFLSEYGIVCASGDFVQFDDITRPDFFFWRVG